MARPFTPRGAGSELPGLGLEGGETPTQDPQQPAPVAPIRL
ncbi:hypothetical protein [Novosphingobium sp. FKTRR1]|nr:hypothetical protein [Novosphingobium sp. FKTRR1]